MLNLIIACTVSLVFLFLIFLYNRMGKVDAFLARMADEESDYRRKIILSDGWAGLPQKWERYESLPTYSWFMLNFWVNLEKFNKPLKSFYKK